jgi:hypothetical protein
MLIYQDDAELLFPPRVIPMLRNLRGEEFRQLVDRVLAHPQESHPEVLGFMLMMIDLNSCLTCTADSYRSMNGCSACAMKVVRSYKGSDADLVEKWREACQRVQTWQQERQAFVMTTLQH